MIAASASGQYNDIECWVGSGLAQSINKDWSWSLQWENRWTQGASWHDQGLVDLALEYRLSKHWDLNAQWRLSERQGLHGAYVARRRFALRTIGSWRVGSGKLTTRIMTAEDWTARTLFSSALAETKITPSTPTIRWRLGYNQRLTNRLLAGASWEVFRREGGRWSERWRAGLDFQLSKRLGFELGYLWENEWLNTDPWRSHVVRIQTSYSIRKAKQVFNRIPATRVYAPVDQALANARCPVCQIDQVRITEVHNKGEPADYIEIQNLSDATCSLEGWRITDDLTKSGWVLPGACLVSGALVLGYENGRRGFSFGLSASGEVLFLIDQEGNVKRQIQVLPAVGGRSQGPGEKGVWSFLEPSPGKVNGGN